MMVFYFEIGCKIISDISITEIFVTKTGFIHAKFTICQIYSNISLLLNPHLMNYKHAFNTHTFAL